MKLKILLVLALSILFSCKNKNKKTLNEDGNVLKIGLILPLTGKYAVIGEGEQKGFELALNDLNKKHPETSIKLYYEDFASETKNAVTAANKLISVNHVDAIITSTTAASEAVSPIIEKNKIIHFVISPDTDILSKSKHNFRIYYNFNTEAEVVSSFLKNEKPESINFFSSKYSSLEKLINNNLVKTSRNLNIEIKENEFVEVTDKDFKNIAVKFKNNDAKMYFLAPMTNQVDLYTNQLSDFGLKPSSKRIMMGSFTFNWKPKIFISSLEGYLILSPVFQTTNSNNAFTERFMKEYNTQPSFDIAYAYDNLTIMTDLLISKTSDFENFSNGFNSLGSYKGVSGTINFIGHNETNAEIIISEIKDGKQIPYKR